MFSNIERWPGDFRDSYISDICAIPHIMKSDIVTNRNFLKTPTNSNMEEKMG